MDSSKRCGKLKSNISDSKKGYAKRFVHKAMRRYNKWVSREEENEYLQSEEI